MANVKISQLPSGTVSDNVVLAGVDSTGAPVTEKFSATSTATYVTNKIAPQIQNMAFSSGNTLGGGAAYTVGFTPALTSYQNNQFFEITFGTGNANNPTIDMDGLGAIPLVDFNGDPLTTGAIPSSGFVGLVTVVNSGTAAMLLNAANVGGGGVTPTQLQDQTFVYGVATGGGDAIILTVAGFTDIAYVDGMGFEFRAPGNNVGLTPSINVNGLGPITIVGSDGQPLLPDSMIGSGTYRITYSTGFGGGFVLHNPSRGTFTSALLAQQMYFQFTGNTGTTNAYAGTYTPAVNTYQTGQMFILSIGAGLTNTSTSVTFDAGAGALPVRLSSGALPAIGDIQENGTYFFTVTDSATEWQLLNPTLSNGGATPQISGTFTPQLLNYTVQGGLDLISTGTYVATGATFTVNMEFTAPYGFFSIDTSQVVTYLNNLPAYPLTSAVVSYTDFIMGANQSATLYEDTGAVSPDTSFGNAIIKQNGVTYLITSTDNSSVFVNEVVATNDSSTLMAYTPVGGSQSIFYSASTIYPFNDGTNDYIIAIDNNEDMLITETFVAGTVTDLVQTALTTNSAGVLQTFTYGGNHYCVVLEDNVGGSVNGEFLETFQWTGSAWTSVDYFDTGVANIEASLFDDGLGNIHMVTTSTAAVDQVYSYAWTGTTWTPWVSTLSLSNPGQPNLFNVDGEYFLVIVSAITTIKLYHNIAGTWTQEDTHTSGSTGPSFAGIINLDNQKIIAWQIGTAARLYTFSYVLSGSSQLTFQSSATYANAANYNGQAIAFNIGQRCYVALASGLSSSDIAGFTFSESVQDSQNAVLYSDGAFASFTTSNVNKLTMTATYPITGIGSVLIPNSTIQSYSTLLAPLTYTTGTNQTYVFDAVTGATSPVTYSSGNFTFPSDASHTWEIIGQFYMTTAAVDNMRLHISSPFSTDIIYSSPVADANVGAAAWCYINWRGSIAPGAVMQVLFDVSSLIGGQFENGTGVTSFMSIRQI